MRLIAEHTIDAHDCDRILVTDSAEEAVAASQIVTTMTSSREPVLLGKWLQPGTHVNAAGGNLLLRREIDDEAVMRASRVVVGPMKGKTT